MLNIASRGGRGLIMALSAVLLLAVTGCAPSAMRWSAMPEDTVTLPDVPDYVQERKQCGPYALAAVVNYWHQRGMTGKSVSPEEISRAIFSRGAGGVLGLDLYRYAGGLDLFADQFKGNAGDLREAVDRGEPVIILVDHGRGPFQINHFMVVSGYSSEGFVVNSGNGLRHIGQQELGRVWARAGHWALAVRPYQPEDRIRRGLDLELRGRLQEALEQYERAGEKDPVVHLYRGNVHFQMKDFKSAEAEYRKAIGLTGDPDAMNNLAWLFFELDRDLDTALELARRAVGLVPDSETYTDTLQRITERLCASPESSVGCPPEDNGKGPGIPAESR